MKTINCGGRPFELSTPRIMGILNMTPDSFYDGGKYLQLESAIARVRQLVQEGADMIDVGGMSSRPGAQITEPGEEASRVTPIIREIRQEFKDIPISIDTISARVAEQALEAGADMINDISGGELDRDMIPLAASAGCPYIVMHMKGIPSDMQQDPRYDDVTAQVLQYLISRLDICEKAGIKDLIIDPGFGFGKSLTDNYHLLSQLEIFSILDRPLLVGISRKSMIYQLLQCDPEQALCGTSAAHLIALQKNARILRVHDVRPAKDVISVWEAAGRV